MKPSSGLPRWVKAFIVVTLALVLIGVVALLAGHSPGRHGAAPAIDAPAQAWTVA